jgi:hypothetical protein
MANTLGDITGLDIDISVISGRGLVAKDKTLLSRKKTSSDVSRWNFASLQYVFLFHGIRVPWLNAQLHFAHCIAAVCQSIL